MYLGQCSAGIIKLHIYHIVTRRWCLVYQESQEFRSSWEQCQHYDRMSASPPAETLTVSPPAVNNNLNYFAKFQVSSIEFLGNSSLIGIRLRWTHFFSVGVQWGIQTCSNMNDLYIPYRKTQMQRSSKFFFAFGHFLLHSQIQIILPQISIKYTWLTAGGTAPAARRRLNCGVLKLETPILFVRPASWSASISYMVRIVKINKDILLFTTQKSIVTGP